MVGLHYIVQQIVKSTLKLFRIKQFNVLIQIVKVLDLTIGMNFEFSSINCKIGDIIIIIIFHHLFADDYVLHTVLKLYIHSI